MNLIVYTIISIFQLVFAYGIHLLNYFTKKKLGMNRWVVYHNMQIDKLLIVSILKYVFLIATIIATIKLLKIYIKKINVSKLLKIDLFILLAINVILAIITLFFNTSSQKLNYYYIIILLLIYILQAIKIYLSGDANEGRAKNKDN